MLEIRHVGLAIFADLHLNQKPQITVDGFNFDTELTIEELQLMYANSTIQQVYELNIAFRNEKRRVQRLP